MSIEDVYPKSRSVRLLRRDPNGDPYDKFLEGVPAVTVEQQALMRASPDAAMRQAAAMIGGLVEGCVGYESAAALSDPIEDLHTPHLPPRERALGDAWRAWDKRNRRRLKRDDRLRSDMLDYRLAGVHPAEAELCRRELERRS